MKKKNTNTALIIIGFLLLAVIVLLVISQPKAPKIQLPNTEISLEASPTENPQGGGIIPDAI